MRQVHPLRIESSVRRLLLCAVLALGIPAAAQAAPSKTLKVAVVADGPSDEWRVATALLKVEVLALVQKRFSSVEFPDEPSLVGDFTEARATEMMESVLADRSVDVVIALGVLTGRFAGNRESLPKPVILPFAVPHLQGLPQKGDASGVKNLAYLRGPLDLDREFRRFKEVIRRDSAILLLDRHYIDVIPNLVDEVGTIAGNAMQVTVLPVGTSASEVLAAIPLDAKSVYIGPLLRLPHSEIQTLIDGINERRLPTYASQGRSWVERGALVTIVPADERDRRMRSVALMLDEAVDGEDLARMPTTFPSGSGLVINMKTARKIGVWPRFDVMTEAELLGEDGPEKGPILDLKLAVRTALEQNQGLNAARQDVKIAREQANQASGQRLPTVDADAGFTWIDKDVASSFTNAQRTVDWGISGTQLLYSPAVQGAVRATRESVRSTEQSVKAAELDIVEASASAYLDVLRARTIEDVSKSNLETIRRNLAFAETRVQVGVAGPEEVLRWEVEIADGRAAVIDSSALRNQAEIELNRLLNRAIEAPLRTAEPTDPVTGIVLDPRVRTLIDDPWSFRIFREFMAQRAAENAPELKALDRAVAAQRAQLQGQQRELFLPDLFVSGGFNHVLNRSGKGSEAPDPMSPIPRDDFTWQVGAGAQFRLYDSPRYAGIRQTEALVGQLLTQKTATSQRVEQRVRAALHRAGASSASVGLRQEAARAAAANRELVTESYRQGTVPIITLLDAQNQAVQTQLGAANAVYDFLLDFIAVERAAGQFGFLSDANDHEQFVTELTRYVVRARGAEALGVEALGVEEGAN